MSKALVIVESPAKVKIISRYLGKDYIVKSSVGHIRDLPTSGGDKVARKPARGLSDAEKKKRAKAALIRRMGVDPEHEWDANYRVVPGKEKILKGLRAAAEKADTIYLATDLDREGEAIAWHLRELLGGTEDRFHRVTFPEITKKAIEAAFKSPGKLNIDRVDAQQARRFLDRVVGFMVSPLLWKKVARGLSAGRVQSVALRLVVEREREIKAFTPEEYWQIHADLATRTDQSFLAEVVRVDGDKFSASSDAETQAVVDRLKRADASVAKITRKPTRAKPSAPFTTSTLQQAASTRLGFGVRKTMIMAQHLYEAGHITYMRTDSTNLSADAVTACREFVTRKFGAETLPEKPVVYTAAGRAQEAHEAIRPSDVGLEPSEISGVDGDAQRLYDLIWRQFVACQMKPATFDTTAIEIDAGGVTLRANGRILTFKGFYEVLPPSKKKGEESNRELPEMKEGDAIDQLAVNPTQHFTKPPARFSEASLVKEMTARGIGRPSTYAAIISTIQDRGYVRVDNRRLHAEKIGEVVTDRLVRNFEDLLDYGFTASLEQKLDRIAEGKVDRNKVLDEFYKDFTKQLAAADESMLTNDPTPTEIECPTCGREMQVRTGSTGVFLGCSGYSLPKKERCTKTLNLVSGEEVETVANGDPEGRAEAETRALRRMHRCPECSTAMDAYLVDETRKLHICGRNPECSGVVLEKGTFKIKGYDGPVITCDKCGADMELKSGRFGKYFGCSADDCKNTRKLLRNGEPAPPKADPVPMPELPCEKSEGHFVLRDGAAGIFLASSLYPRSRETRNPKVAELLPHTDELDPKHLYLVEAPVEDDAGNPTIIRFARKTKTQYVMTENEDGKPSGWSAAYEGGKWVVAKTEKKKPARKRKTAAKG